VGRLSWFGRWEREHHAARQNVIVMDMSFMGKFLVQGRDAGRCLIASRAIKSTAPRCYHLHAMMNERGTLEATSPSRVE